MFKNMSRAIRRHHRARLKKNRKNYWGFGKFGWRGYGTEEIVEMSPFQAGSVARTPKPCSCYMCRNQRHNDWQKAEERLTVQERKALEDYNDQKEEE